MMNVDIWKEYTYYYNLNINLTKWYSIYDKLIVNYLLFIALVYTNYKTNTFTQDLHLNRVKELFPSHWCLCRYLYTFIIYYIYFLFIFYYVRSTALPAIHLQLDIRANAFEIRALKSPKCIVWCAVDCTTFI
jgi:hypothetical protein